MKKLLLGLLLALSATALTQGQTKPKPRKPLLSTQSISRDSASTEPMVPNYPIPTYNPWPWEYQLPHMFSL